jgi:hypothetical protein
MVYLNWPTAIEGAAMFWPFKRRPKQPDIWTEAEQNLIAQGLDPKKVRRAARLVRRMDRAGQLPFNLERGDDKPPG